MSVKYTVVNFKNEIYHSRRYEAPTSPHVECRKVKHHNKHIYIWVSECKDLLNKYNVPYLNIEDKIVSLKKAMEFNPGLNTKRITNKRHSVS